MYGLALAFAALGGAILCLNFIVGIRRRRFGGLTPEKTPVYFYISVCRGIGSMAIYLNGVLFVFGII